MNFTLSAAALAFGLFLSLLVSLEAGRRLGVFMLGRAAGRDKVSIAALEGAVFGLMGLLIAFTFSGAASRFDHRRQLIMDETNAVSTAWLRLDMLPSDAQPHVRDLFRRYLDTRLEIYRRLPDIEAAREELKRSEAIQGEIWSEAAAACRTEAGRGATVVMLPALNQMFDIAATRTMSAKVHPPAVVFMMLIGLALGSSLLAGYDMAGSKARSWVHVLGFAMIMSVAIYIIIDLEFPRLGLIRVDDFDEALRALRQSMG